MTEPTAAPLPPPERDALVKDIREFTDGGWPLDREGRKAWVPRAYAMLREAADELAQQDGIPRDDARDDDYRILEWLSRHWLEVYSTDEQGQPYRVVLNGTGDALMNRVHAAMQGANHG